MTAVTSSPVSVQFRIIRNKKNSLRDEIFTLSKGAHNDWRINHKSTFSQSNSTMFVKCRSDVLDYLMNVVDLLKVDNESYEFIQLDAPCHPVVMVSCADVTAGGSAFHNLLRVVEYVLYNWPSTVAPWTHPDEST